MTNEELDALEALAAAASLDPSFSRVPEQNAKNAAFYADAVMFMPALIMELREARAEVKGAKATAVQEWKDASGYDDLLTAYSAAVYERDLARNRLEAWKSCLHCGNTRADGDFWEGHCPACRHEDRKVNADFARGVAAMREAAVEEILDKAHYLSVDWADDIRSLPCPEDRTTRGGQ